MTKIKGNYSYWYAEPDAWRPETLKTFYCIISQSVLGYVTVLYSNITSLGY